MTPILDVAGLTVETSAGEPIIKGVGLRLDAPGILGLVGESGSGKTTLGLSLLGYANPGAVITAGSITIGREPVLGRRTPDLRRLRGRVVSYVPQDPAAAMNPARRIGDQLADRVAHRPRGERAGLIDRALQRSQLPTGPAFLARFPHQISGGQQQRALIAMAIVAEPSLIVLDEPTTGLDVVTQAALLRELRTLHEEIGASLIYVTHDLAAVSTIADTVAVMYAGRIVERGPLPGVLGEPRHPYTVGLMESVPDHGRPTKLHGLPGTALGVGHWPRGCPFEPRCRQARADCKAAMPDFEAVRPGHEVRCFHWQQTPPVAEHEPLTRRTRTDSAAVLAVDGLRAVHGRGANQVIAAASVSLTVRPGECVALVGESGSGKTTIARCIAGLHKPAAGSVTLDGQVLAAMAGDRTRAQRQRLQFVFQNPYESLNPRHTVGAILSHAAAVLRGIDGRAAHLEAARVLDEVRLPAASLKRYPGELSGGERQRIAIARALIAEPTVLICDEITSALDVSVQAAVLDLLGNLQAAHGLAMVFITHNLGVVASIADKMLVLNHGSICEMGDVDQLIAHPADEYTKNLLAAAPRLEVAGARRA